MKVWEMLLQLQKYDPNRDVLIARPAHDYIGTVLAEESQQVKVSDTSWSMQYMTRKIGVDDKYPQYHVVIF